MFRRRSQPVRSRPVLRESERLRLAVGCLWPTDERRAAVVSYAPLSMGPFLLLRERGEEVDRLLEVAETEPVPLILNKGTETHYYYWRDLVFELVGPLERPVDAALCAAAVTGTISEGDPLDLTAISRAIYERDRGLATPSLADEAVAEPVRIRRPITRDVKMFVWQRDGGRCVE